MSSWTLKRPLDADGDASASGASVVRSSKRLASSLHQRPSFRSMTSQEVSGWDIENAKNTPLDEEELLRQARLLGELKKGELRVEGLGDIKHPILLQRMKSECGSGVHPVKVFIKILEDHSPNKLVVKRAALCYLVQLSPDPKRNSASTQLAMPTGVDQASMALSAAASGLTKQSLHHASTALSAAASALAKQSMHQASAALSAAASDLAKQAMSGSLPVTTNHQAHKMDEATAEKVRYSARHLASHPIMRPFFKVSLVRIQNASKHLDRTLFNTASTLLGSDENLKPMAVLVSMCIHVEPYQTALRKVLAPYLPKARLNALMQDKSILPSLGRSHAKAGQISLPQSRVPQAQLPQYSLPHMNLPQTNLPNLGQLQIEAPQAKSPQLDLAQTKQPQANPPQVHPARARLLQLDRPHVKPFHNQPSLNKLPQINQSPKFGSFAGPQPFGTWVKAQNHMAHAKARDASLGGARIPDHTGHSLTINADKALSERLLFDGTPSVNDAMDVETTDEQSCVVNAPGAQPEVIIEGVAINDAPSRDHALARAQRALSKFSGQILKSASNSVTGIGSRVADSSVEAATKIDTDHPIRNKMCSSRLATAVKTQAESRQMKPADSVLSSPQVNPRADDMMGDVEEGEIVDPAVVVPTSVNNKSSNSSGDNSDNDHAMEGVELGEVVEPAAVVSPIANEKSRNNSASVAGVQAGKKTDDNPDSNVRLCDLSENEQEQQKHYFKLKSDNDLAVCMCCGKRGHVKQTCSANFCEECNTSDHAEFFCPARRKCTQCRQRGHHSSQCTAIPVDAGGKDDPCDICGKTGHAEKDCCGLWQTFKTTPDMQRIKASDMLVFCFNCGQEDHWGDDCTTKAPMFDPDVTAPFSTFGHAHAARFILDPASKPESLSQGNTKGDEPARGKVLTTEFR